MKPRTTLALAAAAGLAASAHAQKRVSVTYSWSEVVAGSVTPVAAPNSVLEPGEGAYIRLNMFANFNGTNAIGQTTTYTPPPPPGVGTARGIASMLYNLTGDNNAPSAYGSWNDRAVSPILSAGSFAGTVLDSGATVDSFSGGQFVLPGQTADATNPIQDAFRGAWTPTSYANRTVRFRASSAAQVGQQNGIMLQYGTGYVDPADPSTAYALYYTYYIGTDFGLGVSIPIIPSPATLPILALFAIPRRDRRPRRQASAR